MFGRLAETAFVIEIAAAAIGTAALIYSCRKADRVIEEEFAEVTPDAED